MVNFFNTHDLAGAHRSILQAEEIVLSHERWMEVNYAPTAAWLAHFPQAY